jgi:hypothetical protein
MNVRVPAALGDGWVAALANSKNTGYMRLSEAMRRTGGAARATGGAFRSGARAGATASRRTGGLVHRVTGASGAGRTGLSTLIELTAAGGASDAFVAVSLAGTIFFSTSVDQARGRVVLFLLVTMAPFAVLAPFIGPALDRMQQGRKFLLAGTLLARGLLCWGMSAAINSPVTLLPAAFGILVLQKAYGVARASVTPRLLPAEITLVAANARSQLITLIASMLGGAVAAGIQVTAGSAWVLRAGTLIYLAATFLALRLPDQVDVPPTPAAPVPPPGRDGRTLPYEPAALPPGIPAHEAAGGRNGQKAAGGRRWRTLANVGPIVGEAMRGNAVLRAFSGYMVFFLAFYLRSAHFGVSHNVTLGALVAAAAAGGLAAMAIGSLLRARAPAFILFSMLTLAPIVTATCAWFFSLTSVIAVAFTAALAAGLAKLSLDSTVQREIGEEIRSSAFAVSETLNQVANVAGSLAGVLVSMLDNGETGLAIAAACLTVALVTLVARRRRRILSARAESEAAYAASQPPPRRPRPRPRPR